MKNILIFNEAGLSHEKYSRKLLVRLSSISLIIAILLGIAIAVIDSISSTRFADKIVLETPEEFKEYMEQINSVNKYDLLLMTFTNVILQGSYFMASGKLADIPNEAFGEGALTDFMPGYVSRKKQIIPSLAEALKN